MSEPSPIPTAARAPRVVRQVAVLAAGLAAGLGIAYVTFGGDDGATIPPPGAAAVGPDPSLPPAADVPVPPGGQPAADPRAAVAAFLRAEADGDFRASWGLLGADDRATYGSVARWVAAHEAIAPVAGFELDPPGGDPAQVPVTLRLRPGLDGVLGLVPATATSVWTAVPEDGGWRVAFGRATVDPVELDDAAAPAAAAAWADARRACATDVDVVEHGTLVGTVGLADRLCGAAGVAADPSAPERLPAVDATRFVSAYGPDAATWARVVDLTGPVPLRAVLAPVDDRWVVIGVLPPTTS